MSEKGGVGMAGEKILIVDDDKNICELLRLYLVTPAEDRSQLPDSPAELD